MCTSKVCRTFIPGIAGTTPGSVNLVRSLPSCSFRSFLYVFKFGATKSVGKSPFPRPAAATQFFLLWNFLHRGACLTSHVRFTCYWHMEHVVVACPLRLLALFTFVRALCGSVCRCQLTPTRLPLPAQLVRWDTVCWIIRCWLICNVVTYVLHMCNGPAEYCLPQNMTMWSLTDVPHPCRCSTSSMVPSALAVAWFSQQGLTAT